MARGTRIHFSWSPFSLSPTPAFRMQRSIYYQYVHMSGNFDGISTGPLPPLSSPGIDSIEFGTLPILILVVPLAFPFIPPLHPAPFYSHA